jgi:hypothetical protein
MGDEREMVGGNGARLCVALLGTRMNTWLSGGLERKRPRLPRRGRSGTCCASSVSARKGGMRLMSSTS